MSNCRKCGCRCDPGDLQDGVCDDCREAERQEDTIADYNRKMLARYVMEQEDGQLVMI